MMRWALVRVNDGRALDYQLRPLYRIRITSRSTALLGYWNPSDIWRKTKKPSQLFQLYVGIFLFD